MPAAHPRRRQRRQQGQLSANPASQPGTLGCAGQPTGHQTDGDHSHALKMHNGHGSAQAMLGVKCKRHRGDTDDKQGQIDRRCEGKR